jgi:hypothetical protein
MMTSFASRFAEQGFVHYDGLLDEATCKLATQYALFDRSREFTPELTTPQVAGVHSKYADPFMEALLVLHQPTVESIVECPLVPTYSYMRVYQQGAVLERHKDRCSCEISMSVCLGYYYHRAPDGFRWALHVGPVDGSTGTAGTSCPGEPGGAVIYKGCQVEHWRERFLGGPDSYHVQAFLHYVDAEGPYARACRYDSRPALGLPQSTRNMKRMESLEKELLKAQGGSTQRSNGQAPVFENEVINAHEARM